MLGHVLPWKTRPLPLPVEDFPDSSNPRLLVEGLGAGDVVDASRPPVADQETDVVSPSGSEVRARSSTVSPEATSMVVVRHEIVGGTFGFSRTVTVLEAFAVNSPALTVTGIV